MPPEFTGCRHQKREPLILNGLRGGFWTGEDLGTTPEDMLLLSRVTPYVHGCDAGSETAKDPGPYTALGVFAGIRATLARIHGDDDPRGRRILIQGIGDVGAPLSQSQVTLKLEAFWGRRPTCSC